MRYSKPKRNLFEYSDARAAEYDKNYITSSTASMSDSNSYREDVSTVSRLLPEYISGEHIDLACGTGFWLQFYEKNCHAITLIDQSERMLYECSLKIKQLGIENKVKIICDDLFNYPFEQNKYDSALIGFLISLLTKSEEHDLFNILKRILKPGGIFIIIDSIWNNERAANRKKTGIQKRVVNDGCEFQIYKRYFEKKDFDDLAEKHKVNLSVIHEGKEHIAAVGSVD